MSDATTNNAGRFSVAAAEHALRVACCASGLDHTNAELIRLGENALFRLLSQPVVVRIARTMDYWADVVKEVGVAHWLAEHQFPAAQVLDVPQPVRAAGHPVTFWRYIPGRPGNGGDMAALGAVLRWLHQTPCPTTFDLPRGDIFGRVDRRIESAPVAAADKDFLLRRLEELRSEVSRLRYPLSPTVTHGDAHVKNLILYDDQAILIDFEQFAWGQPEWDLALTATEYQTAGWWTHAEYGQFAEAYGYDVTSWRSGFDVLRAAHEIKLTTWLMQNVNESVEVAAEYQTRMRTIRGIASASDRWNPF
ncbi:MAG: aminoglycoside phosphotransferase family protein [Actinomycetota bacterium]|nr:aminoglycoside phosphotransferase family protein [Actinomycetota bacterium]